MTSILGQTRKPDLIFRASGLIEITSRVARALNLRHGDVIDILIDDEEEWYLYVKYRTPIGRHEGVVRQSNKRGYHFRVWSKRMTKAVLAECGSPNVAKLCVGAPTELKWHGAALPIIYKHQL